MHVTVNEHSIEISPGTTLYALRDRMKPGADILVLNGGPVSHDAPLDDGDAVVLIKRGETPSQDELESLMAARHSPGVHEKIKCASVGIAGLGGLGSAIAVALARIGVGRLVLADYDVVEPSNLNRQQYFVDQIGMAKTEALRENLERMNPYVAIETHYTRLTPQNLPELFHDVDVMAEAFDTAPAKAMIMEVFSRSLPAIPLVMATGLAGHEPSNTIVTRQIRSNVVICGDLVTAAGPGMGLMAPRVGVAAHHQANAILRILLDADPVGGGES